MNVMTVIDTLLHGLQLALEMGWATWWALVFGFTIAGAVESFVSEEMMSRALGGRGWRSVALGTLFGAVSSSCSFDTIATIKSLFKKKDLTGNESCGLSVRKHQPNILAWLGDMVPARSATCCSH